MTHDVRVYAFSPKKNQWYRLVQDYDGRIAYLRVEESEIRKGDAKTEIPDHAMMVGASV